MRPPLDEYAARKRDREATAAARERTHVHLGNAKVAIFIAAVIYTAYAMSRDPSPAIYGIGVAVFVALSIWHEVVMRALARAQAAVTYYADGAARIEDRWMRETPSGDRFRDRDHPYADDLDVFGAGSLFQLLSSCRTPMGEDRLAGWLLHPSPIPDIRERQARVAALRGRIDLRERIAVVNAGRRRSIQADRLIAWAEQPPSLPPVRPMVIALALAICRRVCLLHERRPRPHRRARHHRQPGLPGVARQTRERDRRSPWNRRPSPPRSISSRM